LQDGLLRGSGHKVWPSFFDWPTSRKLGFADGLDGLVRIDVEKSSSHHLSQSEIDGDNPCYRQLSATRTKSSLQSEVPNSLSSSLGKTNRTAPTSREPPHFCKEYVPEFLATHLNSESWTIRTKTCAGYCSRSAFARMSVRGTNRRCRPSLAPLQ
jgi:hypothetical protein